MHTISWALVGSPLGLPEFSTIPEAEDSVFLDVVVMIATPPPPPLQWASPQTHVPPAFSSLRSNSFSTQNGFTLDPSDVLKVHLKAFSLRPHV